MLMFVSTWDDGKVNFLHIPVHNSVPGPFLKLVHFYLFLVFVVVQFLNFQFNYFICWSGG